MNISEFVVFSNKECIWQFDDYCLCWWYLDSPTKKKQSKMGTNHGSSIVLMKKVVDYMSMKTDAEKVGKKRVVAADKPLEKTSACD